MDREQIELEGLIRKVELYCKEHGMPMFITVHSGQKENNGYYTRMVSPASIGQNKPDDKISDLVLIMNGFTAIPEHNKTTIEVPNYIGQEVTYIDDLPQDEPEI